MKNVFVYVYKLTNTIDIYIDTHTHSHTSLYELHTLKQEYNMTYVHSYKHCSCEPSFFPLTSNNITYLPTTQSWDSNYGHSEFLTINYVAIMSQHAQKERRLTINGILQYTWCSYFLQIQQSPESLIDCWSFSQQSSSLLTIDQ